MVMKGRTFQRAKLTTVEVAEIKLLLNSGKHIHGQKLRPCSLPS
jgi:hypothetical protein